MFGSTQAIPVSGPPQSDLQVALLGSPSISWLGRPLPLARRQARALLFRLAAAPQPVPRDQLCFLLWPDLPDPVARRNLSVLLDQLRRALPAPDALLKSGEAVALNPAVAWADTIAFARLAPAALRAQQRDRLAYTTLLYRGPFLDGFALPGSAEFDDWAAAERQAWERRFLDTVAALVEAHTAAGEHGAAIDAAQRYLAVDVVAEEMHRRVMELYGAVGDRAGALRQFERCVVALERELGVDPLPATRAVYEALRDGLGLPEGTPAAPSESTPLRLISTAQPSRPAHGGLPAPSSSMIGRGDEIAAARALLRDKTRLITLCGPGGSGKTRLALELARLHSERFADGVVWVPLAPLRDPALVAQAVVQACGLQLASAVDPAAALRAHLADKHLLLVLDNAEHLLPATALFAALLAAAPRVQLLVTSRSMLNLYGEHALPVLPLPLPDPEQLPVLEILAQQPALALLLARTRAHLPGFQLTEGNAADLATICVHLDGLPLAIELAAARLKLLSPRELLKRLDRRLAVLDRGAHDLPDRQRSLRATIEWSYRLLERREQRLFEHLAVFSGGFTLAGIEAIALSSSILDSRFSMLNSLQILQDSHLIYRDREASEEPSGRSGSAEASAALPSQQEPRFGVLETIREFAAERLRERDDEHAIRRGHALHFCHKAETYSPWRSRDPVPVLVNMLRRDDNNIRAAIEWSIAAGDAELGARIVCALHWYWELRGLVREGRAWQAQVLRLGSAVPQPLRARVQSQAAYLAYLQGHFDDASELAQAIRSDREADGEAAAGAANVTGLVAMDRGDLPGAIRYFEQSKTVAQEHGLLRDVAGTQLNLAICLILQSKHAEAEAALWSSHAGYEQLGHAHGVGVTLLLLGTIAVLRDETQQAASLLRDGVQTMLGGGETTFLPYGLLAFGTLATINQAPHRAASLYSAAHRHAAELGLTLSTAVMELARAYTDRAREQLTSDEWDRAWSYGRSLSLDQAIELALAPALERLPVAA